MPGPGRGDLHVRVVRTIQDELHVPAGFSDHSADVRPLAAIAAVALGACVYERHFTLDRSLPGPDHAASLTAEMLGATIAAVRETERALGSREKRLLGCEVENRQKLRKSIVAAVPIPAGAVLTADVLDCRRPGSGICPTDLGRVVGRRATEDIAAETLIDWAMISGDGV